LQGKHDLEAVVSNDVGLLREFRPGLVEHDVHGFVRDDEIGLRSVVDGHRREGRIILVGLQVHHGHRHAR